VEREVKKDVTSCV